MAYTNPKKEIRNDIPNHPTLSYVCQFRTNNRVRTEQTKEKPLKETKTMKKRQNAYYAKKNISRLDGNTYKVETSNINQTVTVSVVPVV